jgi:predicted DsbA family dithiol-disulfide isomerase/uncharacterized membrane protein
LWIVTVALVLAALVASAALFVDYLKPAPVFCDDGGGCGTVKQTTFAHVYGIPTPGIGLFGMAVIALTLLSSASWAPAVTLLVSSAGALVAAYLIYVQTRMGVFCVYCMTFDSVMVLLPFFAATRLRLSRGPEAFPPFSWRLGAAVVLVLGALAPTLVGHFLKPHVPEAILKEMEQTPRGQVTVVDFVDFECPYCRMTHATLAPLLAREAGHVRLVRVNMPLTRIHAHADIAARAEICGERLASKPEQVDTLVDKLFTLPEEELEQDPLVSAAGEVGLDAAAFTRCLADPKTAARLEQDAAAFKSVGGRGLPLLYIDTRRIEGAQDGPVLDAALRQAEAAK